MDGFSVMSSAVGCTASSRCRPVHRRVAVGLTAACMGLGVLTGCGSATASPPASASVTSPAGSASSTGASNPASATVSPDATSGSATPGGSAASSSSAVTSATATRSASATPRPSATRTPARVLPGELAPDKVQHHTPTYVSTLTWDSFRFPRSLESLPRYSLDNQVYTHWAWYVNARKASDFVDVETDIEVDQVDMASYYLNQMADPASYRGGTIICGMHDTLPVCIVRFQKWQYLDVSGSTSPNRLAKYTTELLDAQG